MTTIGTRLWLEIETVDEGESWSAFVDALQLASAGRSEDEAIRHLLSAVRTYAEILKRRGVLEKALQDKGIEYEGIKQERMPLRKVPLDITASNYRRG